MKCSVAHCDKAAVAHGVCHRHYYALRKYGDPTKLKQKQHHGLTLRERFFRYVKQTEGCWEWLGYRDPNGYGRINVDGIPKVAPRVSYLLHYGDVPEDRGVLHKCDNPECVNPDHLFLGTQADNVADMHGKGRARKRGLKGEEHGMAKLTPDIVRAIRASQLGTNEAAAEYGISPTTVADIRKRRSWKHID